MAGLHETVDDLTGLAATAVDALRAVHAPGASAEQFSRALQVFEQLKAHPAAHELAFRLSVAEQAPEVQHYGFQLLLSRLRPGAGGRALLGERERAEAKTWMVSLLASDRWSTSAASPGVPPSSPDFVRRKCAECIAELAKLDWPGKWPELQPALLAATRSSSASVGPALLALSIWSQIAGLLAEDSKDLTVARRRELSEALTRVMEQPTQSPDLVATLQDTLQRYGADQRVVQEALGLCRALATGVPVRLLLQYQLDKIVQVGIQMADLRELSVSVLAEWVDNLYPTKKGGGGGAKGSSQTIPPPANHDICRFTAMLAVLVSNCLFDPGDPLAYAFHRQVGELLCDLCVQQAASFCQLMPSTDLARVWQALLHLLRYPSSSMQYDALTGMIHLARGQSSGWTKDEGSPPRPPLEQLLGVLLVLTMRHEQLPCSADKVPGGGASQSRSAWLLQCLGPVSARQQPSVFADWCKFLEASYGFDLLEGEVDAQERSKLFGNLKARCNEFLCEICRPRLAQKSSSEGYAALCRFGGALVARSLAGDGASSESWIAEFSSGTTLMESCSISALKYVEKQGTAEWLQTVLQPSQAFFQQVMVQTETFSVLLEHRKLEFLSCWGAFYKHYGQEVLAPVFQHVLARVKDPATATKLKGTNLRQRALDTLIGISKNGDLQAAQLEPFSDECQRLAPQLSPQARGKLLEALAAAVASCASLERGRQMELICGMMQQATTAWLSTDLVQTNQPHGLLSVLVAASAANSDSTGEQNRDRLRDIRTLLNTFTGVVARASNCVGDTSKDCNMEDGTDTRAPLASTIVRDWAPGIFNLLQALSGLCVLAVASGDEAAQTLVLLPARAEHEGMLGSKTLEADETQEVTEVLPGTLDATSVANVRGMLWEMRSRAAKAARACVSCSCFWQLQGACSWLKTLAQSLPGLRPHVAESLLRDIFAPAFGKNAPGPPSDAKLSELCREVTVPLVTAIVVLLRECWGLGREVPVEVGLAHGSMEPLAKILSAAVQAVPAMLPVPPMLEPALAASVVSLTRCAAFLLASLAGAEQPQAGLVANPDRWLFKGTQPEPQMTATATGRRKKKNRNKNRFEALGEEHVPVENEVDDTADCLAEPPKGFASAILREKELREALRWALVNFLYFPERDSVARALLGLSVWCAQLWNMIARGHDPVMLSSGSLPQVGEFIHAASDALRSVPAGALKPIAQLVSKKADSFLGKACSSLDSSVQQAWTSFAAASHTNGKRSASILVSECTHGVFTALMVLVRLFKLQCRNLNLKAEPQQLYLCPALSEALQICRQMHNTSQDDVDLLLATMLDHKHESITAEMQRSTVRALLHEASPAFETSEDVNTN
eukprot:TRINITY_DN23631_c0_g2_i1.p1 TRINITY_DN23631_c0_g2~~TRINITY_DN23631_c0_g2_i1.p1  ORF type:complete len:1356 (-),score=263.01 TRINITY_DN23631_c0_g2_i1:261-4328(-)